MKGTCLRTRLRAETWGGALADHNPHSVRIKAGFAGFLPRQGLWSAARWVELDQIAWIPTASLRTGSALAGDEGRWIQAVRAAAHFEMHPSLAARRWCGHHANLFATADQCPFGQ